MVTAFVLVNNRKGTVNDTAQKLVDMEEVSEVYSVAGQWDLVVVLRARDNEALADLVTSRILQIDGIEKTTTIIAFKAYSKHDLERIFGVGQPPAKT